MRGLWCLVVAVCASSALSEVGQAVAQDLSLAWSRCKDDASADLKIEGCTAVIRSAKRAQRVSAAFNNRGNGYFLKKEYSRAIADYDQAIKLDHRNYYIFHNRAVTHYYQKEYDLAIADYNEAIKLSPKYANPKYAELFNGRGLVYQVKGDLDRAIADFREALRLNHGLQIAATNLANANQAKAINSTPHLVDPLVEKGWDRQLQLKPFIRAYNHVRADYLQKPDEWQLVEAALQGLMKAPAVPAGLEEAQICKEQLASHGADDALACFARIYDEAHNSATSPDSDTAIVEASIKSMIASVDKASSYINAKAYLDVQKASRGETGGVGVEMRQAKESVRVLSRFDDSPAAKAGITAGDTITQIDSEPVHDIHDAVDRLRGPVNTPVKLSLTHAGSVQPLELTLRREVIRVLLVRRAEGADVGYIRISQFNKTTTGELRKAIDDLNSKLGAEKIKGFIIDLRNDPGGLLDQAITVSDTFLETGNIVSTEGRGARSNQKFSAGPGDLTEGKPLIVLVNHESAGASEIVAAALPDHGRATIVGTRSNGRGSVQTVFPLGAGNGVLTLTTSLFYRPNGHLIDGDGITPDIEVVQTIPDDVKDDPSVDPQTYVPEDEKSDTALQMALNLIRGIEKNAQFPPKAKP